ncbi:hypothetical protein ABW20_dc0100979 [Dactylellina cionopaga]|nr:hypothetical protein ABW20_dc0100979 [Dactylellina cionopaga]
MASNSDGDDDTVPIGDAPELHDLGCASDSQDLIDTADTALQFAQQYSIEHGFVVTKRSGCSNDRIRLKCDKGGSSTSGGVIRKSSSRLLDCPYQLNIYRQKKLENEPWKISPSIHRLHNHEATPPEAMSAHSRVRMHGITTSHVDLIKNLSTAAVPPRKVASVLPFFRYQHDDMNQITHLFYAFKDAIALARAYNVVFLLDSTYKTNVFKMPLLHCVGTTSTYHTFTLFICFMRAEKEADYAWAISIMRELLGDTAPKALVTDRELALMNAIQVYFPQPETTNLLCVWHINKNIAANHKRSYPMGKHGWEALKSNGDIVTPPELAQYIESQWLPYKETFARPWIGKILHLKHSVTSRVEGAHARLKSYLDVSTGDLLFVFRQTLQAHLDECFAITQRIAQQQQRDNANHRDSLFDRVRRQISWYALDEVYEQLKLYQYTVVAPQNHKLGTCTGEFTATMGLPCKHTIAGLKLVNRPLSVLDFHPTWLLKLPPKDNVAPASGQASTPSFTELARRLEDVSAGWHPHEQEAARRQMEQIITGAAPLLQAPAIVTGTKGRPKGALGKRKGEGIRQCVSLLCSSMQSKKQLPHPEDDAVTAVKLAITNESVHVLQPQLLQRSIA